MSEPRLTPMPRGAKPIVVRRGRPRDARAIAAVHVASYRAAYAGILPLEKLTVERREHAWRGILEPGDRSSFTLVAEADGEVLGFCHVAAPSRDSDANGERAEVASIYVAPDRWRGGIGRLLLAGAFTELASHEAWRDVTVWVLAVNDRARAFYSTFGFAPDGAELVHAASGQSEIRLRAKLR